MSDIIECPIRGALNDLKLGSKWTLEIIHDMFYGKKYFKEFLMSNPKLSKKVLAERLKGLTDNGLIKRNVVNKSPMIIEYELTQKGEALNKVLYELAMFRLNTDERYGDDSAVQLFKDELKEKLRVIET